MRLVMWQLLKLTTIFLCCIPALFRSRSNQAIVEIALRQQLATFAVKGRRPQIAPADRGFWVLLSQPWSGWKETLVFVQPATVVCWHRKGFGLYWRSISKRGPGQPPIPVEGQALIRRFANENGWRARKVRAELAKLGLSVSLATVSRYLPKRDPDRRQRQRWKTFLRNHKHGITAMDFLVVPTARFRLLYAWFVIVLNEDHLQHLLQEYVDYYNADRVHTVLQDSPNSRPAEHRPTPKAQVVGLPRVGGLHHRYEWQDAA